jgi:signal transduction histidine kinase
MVETQAITSPRASDEWLVWPDATLERPGADEGRLLRFRLTAFRIVLLIAAVALLAMVVRGVVMGGEPWADFFNALFLLVVQWAARRRPRWLRVLAWLVLLSLFINAVDGIYPLRQAAITGTHVVLPLLVLYGALMGDLWMSIVALVVVLGIYVGTGYVYAPLGRADTVKLFNLSIAAVATGFAALSVWVQHRRLEDALRRRAEELRGELATRLRLSAVISHDIRNPLGALLAVVELAKIRGNLSEGDLDTIDATASRIVEIINSVRDVEQQSGGGVRAATCSVEAIHAELQRMTAHRLAEKDQTLILAGGGELSVCTRPQLLCNSVLSNILINAIKFSPRGSALEVSAQVEGPMIRIQVRDPGPGFPDDILEQAARELTCRSVPGTEGERGTGYGLHIAALYARMLSGRLEICTRAEGGAAVAVVLPAAGEEGRQATRTQAD